jgi:hypothetical protein
VSLAAGLGAQRLLRAAIELLSEALAAAWDGGSRGGVNLLLLPRSPADGWHEQAVRFVFAGLSWWPLACDAPTLSFA